MVRHDPTDALGLYLDWLRRRLPGWGFYAECNEGQMVWIGVIPGDPSIPPRDFYGPPNGERQAMVDVYTWLIDLHRKKKLPAFTWEAT